MNVIQIKNSYVSFTSQRVLVVNYGLNFILLWKLDVWKRINVIVSSRKLRKFLICLVVLSKKEKPFNLLAC